MFVLLLLSLLSLSTGITALTCNVPGRCNGRVEAVSSSTSYANCLSRCQSNSYCSWFTFTGPATEDCILFSDCPAIEPFCSGCFTGQSECPSEQVVCDASGICVNGQSVGSDTAADATECLELCQANPDCLWYSYYPGTTNCTMTSDCPSVSTCTGCLHGQTTCPTEGVVHLLFVVGQQSEVINIKGSSSSDCSQPAFENRLYQGSVGTFIDNAAMVCGGYNGVSTRECYTYDPVGEVWQETTPMLEKRAYAAAVMLSDTKWWITGGRDEKSTEIFTVGQGFAPFVDLPGSYDMSDHQLIKIDATHVMLLEDYYSVYMFDFSDEIWRSMPSVPEYMYHFHSGLVTFTDGRSEVLLVEASGSSSSYYSQVFSVDTQTWQQKYLFPGYYEPSYGVSVQNGDTFLALGGQNSRFIYEFDQYSESWILLQQQLGNNYHGLYPAFMIPEGYISC